MIIMKIPTTCSKLLFMAILAGTASSFAPVPLSFSVRKMTTSTTTTPSSSSAAAEVLRKQQHQYQQQQKQQPLSINNMFLQEEEEEEEKNKSVMELSSSSSSSSLTTTILSTTLASSALLLFMPHDAAFAAGPDWGLFEGKTGSLLHPVSMASLFFYTLYTGYLGLQWRRQRTMTTEINALKKQIPKFKESTIDEAIAAAAKESTDGSGSSSLVAQLTAAKPIQAQVASMEAERKELIAKGPRDQHFKSGSLLAFLGTFFAIEGPLNTYARAGKLFPGPHLYAGAACVVLWSAAFATVPSMQKGNDTARSIHIASNTIGLGLFGWQVVSGIPILLKVIEKTKWP